LTPKNYIQRNEIKLIKIYPVQGIFKILGSLIFLNSQTHMKSLIFLLFISISFPGFESPFAEALRIIESSPSKQIDNGWYTARVGYYNARTYTRATYSLDILHPRLLNHKKSSFILRRSLSNVPRAGVEPARPKALVFETNASTDSAIWAFGKSFYSIDSVPFLSERAANMKTISFSYNLRASLPVNFLS
jgi:hypothetical protein